MSASFLNLAFAKNNKKNKFDPEQLADKIVVGLLSEEEFLKMELTEEQKLEVFKKIKEKRGWQISDEELAAILNERNETMAMGSCNQKIEMESGSYEAVYPSRQTSPSDGECGPDKTDIVLEYGTGVPELILTRFVGGILSGMIDGSSDFVITGEVVLEPTDFVQEIQEYVLGFALFRWVTN